jgi:hypothetical protein
MRKTIDRTGKILFVTGALILCCTLLGGIWNIFLVGTVTRWMWGGLVIAITFVIPGAICVLAADAD